MSQRPVVIFATPSLDRRVALDFFCSSIETQRLLMQRGIGHGYIQLGGDPYLAKVRNKLVAMFLEQREATDLFFLDDDIGWPAEKVVEFIQRPEPVLAGIYPKKADQLEFPLELMADIGAGTLIERDGLVRAIGVPTGFLRIKRHVLEQLAAAARTFEDIDANGVMQRYPYIFEMGLGPDGRFWGEDYLLCRKWADLGGEIWVDPDIKFTHRGSKAWSATLGDHIDVFRDKARAARAEQAVA